MCIHERDLPPVWFFHEEEQPATSCCQKLVRALRFLKQDGHDLHWDEDKIQAYDSKCRDYVYQKGVDYET